LFEDDGGALNTMRANLRKNLTEEFHEREEGDLSLVNTMKFVPAFLCYYLF
jgi:hypothetical protein